MTMPKRYVSARAFSQALDERLRTLVKTKAGYDIARVRRQVAFDRLLARLFAEEPAAWILKGGYAMELRTERARATRDVDLALPDGRTLASNDSELIGITIQRELQRQASADLNDFFEFQISEPILDIDAAPYGGARFHVEARLAGKTFAKFHLDVGIGDTVLLPLDVLKSADWLSFVDVKAGTYLTLSKEQQFAEKVHAYTLPRDENRGNSRVKDLVDMLLLIDAGTLDRARVKAALEATFKRRATHPLSMDFPDAPVEWDKPFARLSDEVGLSRNLLDAVDLVRAFLAEVAAGNFKSIT